MEGKQLREKFRTTWRNVVQRCTNPIDSRYEYYSRFGVCNEWLEFRNFERDMLQSFVMHVGLHGMKDTTIDRIDNEKGYSKENCRWATWRVQRENSQHKPLPILTKKCPQCGSSFETKSRAKIYCTSRCSSLFRRYTPQERDASRIKRQEQYKEKYHTDPEVRKRHTISVVKYHKRKMATDEEYKKRQNAYTAAWAKKKFESDPIYRARIRERGRLAYQKYWEKNKEKERTRNRERARKIALEKSTATNN